MNSPSDASLLAWLRLQQPPSSLAACASLSDLSDGVALAAAFNALAPPHLATICAEEPVARLEALSAVLSSQCAQLGLSWRCSWRSRASRWRRAAPRRSRRRLVEGAARVRGARRPARGGGGPDPADGRGAPGRADAADRAAVGDAARASRRRRRRRDAAAAAAAAQRLAGRGDSPGQDYSRAKAGERAHRRGCGARARETLEDESDRLRAARRAERRAARKVEEVHWLRFRAATAEAEAAEARRRRDGEARRSSRRATPSCASCGRRRSRRRRRRRRRWARSGGCREAEAAKLRDARCAQAGGAGAGAPRPRARVKVRCGARTSRLRHSASAPLTARKGAVAAAARRRTRRRRAAAAARWRASSSSG